MAKKSYSKGKGYNKPQQRVYDFPTTGGPGWTFGSSECDRCHKPTTNLRTFGSTSQKTDLCRQCMVDSCQSQLRADEGQHATRNTNRSK